MSQVRHHAKDRLRTHLWKRNKIRNRRTGVLKFPRRVLYRRYGATQTANEIRLEFGARLGMKSIGKP